MTTALEPVAAIPNRPGDEAHDPAWDWRVLSPTDLPIVYVLDVPGHIGHHGYHPTVDSAQAAARAFLTKHFGCRRFSLTVRTISQALIDGEHDLKVQPPESWFVELEPAPSPFVDRPLTALFIDQLPLAPNERQVLVSILPIFADWQADCVRDAQCRARAHDEPLSLLGPPLTLRFIAWEDKLLAMVRQRLPPGQYTLLEAIVRRWGLELRESPAEA